MTSARFVRVDRSNPFVLNRLGVTGTPFPLSMQRARLGDVTAAHGTALRVSDFVDLASNHLDEFAAVFNVGHNTWFDDQFEPLPPHDVAKRQGVEAIVHDFTWASPARDHSPKELLVVASNRLQTLFHGWEPYDVDLLLLPRQPFDAEVDEFILAANTWRPDGAALISMVPVASLYFSGHDDDFFYYESTAPELAEAVLSRLLVLLAGSALVDTATDAQVPEPDSQIAVELFAHSDVWVGQPERLTNGTVDVHLTPATWKLSDKSIPYSPTFSAVVDPTTATWVLRPASSDH